MTLNEMIELQHVHGLGGLSWADPRLRVYARQLIYSDIPLNLYKMACTASRIRVKSIVETPGGKLSCKLGGA